MKMTSIFSFDFSVAYCLLIWKMPTFQPQKLTKFHRKSAKNCQFLFFARDSHRYSAPPTAGAICFNKNMELMGKKFSEKCKKNFWLSSIIVWKRDKGGGVKNFARGVFAFPLRKVTSIVPNGVALVYGARAPVIYSYTLYQSIALHVISIKAARIFCVLPLARPRAPQFSKIFFVKNPGGL